MTETPQQIGRVVHETNRALVIGTRHEGADDRLRFTYFFDEQGVVHVTSITYPCITYP